MSSFPRPTGRARSLVRSTLAALAAGALLMLVPAAAAPAFAAEGKALSWRASLGGRDVLSGTGTNPIRLDPAANTELKLNVKNTGSVPLTVTAAVLEGRVIGLPFFSYKASLGGLQLAPGQTIERAFPLDLSDLGDQATGLIPSRVRLLGASKEALATQSFVVDVRGRALSVYGVFGLVIAIVTIAIMVGLLISLARRRLPANRWQRAMQFLPVGVGIGFVATFTLSATRVLAPSAALWVPLVLICGAVAFVLGYLAPAPEADEADQVDGVPRQRGRRAAATTAAVGAGGAGAIFAEHQADAGSVGTYDGGTDDDGSGYGDDAPH